MTDVKPETESAVKSSQDEATSTVASAESSPAREGHADHADHADRASHSARSAHSTRASAEHVESGEGTKLDDNGPPAGPTQTIVEAVLDLGAAWARYGLVIGKLALKTSAKTLESTANILGTLADEFDRKREAETDKAA